MNEFKKYAQIALKVGEYALLLVIGTYLIYLNINDIQIEKIGLAVKVVGAAIILLGLVPLVASYVKHSLPTVEKKK